MKFKKIFLGSLFYSFIFWYCVFSAGLPMVVRAEDETPTPEATATVEASASPSESPAATETPVESSTPEATETPSSVPSGEASIMGVGPSSEGSCTPSPTPDTYVETGNAESAALSETESNVLGVEVSSGSSGESTSQDNPSIVPSPCSNDLSVVSSQDADSETTSTASATTGDNTALGSTVELVTGDALAIASSINISNISLVGSNVYYLVDTITGTESGNINLYEIMLQLQLSSLSNVPLDLVVVSDQTADQITSASASSDTGRNFVCADTGEVETGNAVSVSSSIDLANFLLVGSNGIFSIINVAGTLNGDIILPNLSGLSGALPWTSVYVVNNQTADIQTTSGADSNTGENVLGGSGSTLAGDAISSSSSVSIANILKIGDSWGMVILNVFGNWQGALRNWGTPGSASEVGNGSSILEVDGESPSSEGQGGSLTVISNQDANITNASQAESNTGGNILGGNGSIDTGNALSISNSFSLANLVGIGGNFFVGVFNIVGNWFGDLVVAYPDLAVSITDNKDEVHPGDGVEYEITLANNGDGYANGASLRFDGSSGFLGQGDTTWNISQMAPGEVLSFRVTGQISSESASEGVLGSSATVSMADDEESTDNNSAVDTTRLTLLFGSNFAPDHTNPNLRISIKNNVAAYIYPGDTILAEITVENTGPVVAREVVISGSLGNEYPMPAIPMGWKLGNMDPGKKMTVNFSISLIKDLPEGNYYLSALAKGYNPAGDEVTSSLVSSSFFVKLMGYVSRISSPAEASGEVLGVTSEAGSPPVSASLLVRWKEYLPYVLALSLASLLVSMMAKRRLRGESLLPVPQYVLGGENGRRLFRNFIVKLGGITGIFFGLVALFVKILHRH